MKKIRIGNDIIIRATVTRLGEAEDFTDKTLALTLRSAYETVSLPFSVSGNVLTAAWLGSQQKKTGTYTLTLTLDYGDGNRNTVDECGVFALVSRSCEECASQTGTQTVGSSLDIARSSGETEDIDLDVSAPSNGLSAYEIAVKHGYEGTEAEWLASLAAEGRVAMVLPYCGTVANVSLQPDTCDPDFVAFDEDRLTFVGAVSSGSSVMYYSDFTAYKGFAAADYGTESDGGRVPVLQRMYVDTETDTLFYWDGEAMRAVNAAITEEEIAEITGYE